MMRIGKALIPKFQTMDFLYAKRCVLFFFEILKNPPVKICEELASEGIIPLLI